MKIKTLTSCNSINVICFINCSSCFEEYIEETGACKTRLRDWVRICRQHIKQTDDQQLKVFSLYPGFLSLTFTFHMTAGEMKAIFISFPPLPPTLQTNRH